MEGDKLRKEDRGITRELWESVFSEDTPQFLDYYYENIASDNEMYGIFRQGKLASMVHLNPYAVQIQKQVHTCHYMVAVATRKEYRGQGYMGCLLRKALFEMYKQKEPFTFLMPAAEAIYRPYDFRFIYDQGQFVTHGVDAPLQVHMRVAQKQDAEAMSAFFQQSFQGKYQVCTLRDPAYYGRLLLEQQSQQGGICLLEGKEGLVGMFFFAHEQNWEIREPLCLPAYQEEMPKAIYQVCGGESVRVFGGEPSTARKPTIMARILRVEVLLSAMNVRQGQKLACSFALLDPVLPGNSKIWRLTSDAQGRILVGETEDSQGVLTVGALTSLLFGYKNVEEIAGEEAVILPKDLQEELGKIQPLVKVFLNEIV